MDPVTVTTPPAQAEKRSRGLSRNVIALGFVSLLNDLAGDIVSPLLPVFITTTLGLSAVSLGLIEGAADSASAFLKLYTGRLSDRIGHRKLLVIIGYGVAAVARPCLALAVNFEQVLGLRVIDRIGKGARTSPRDAMLAAAAPVGGLGRAFGFHRAMDNLGAVGGPLMAFALLKLLSGNYRLLFALTAIPGVLTIAVLLGAVSDGGPAPSRKSEPASPWLADLRELPRPLWVMLLAIFVFTLGNSSDAFLLLRAEHMGIAPVYLPLLWMALNLSRALSSYPAGAWSDRVGRRRLIISGWLIYAAVYAGFAMLSGGMTALALFVVYGLYFGFCEGVERAAIVEMCPRRQTGGVLGLYHFVIGLGALPASLILGALWESFGPRVAFGFGAALALTAVAIAYPVLASRRLPGLTEQELTGGAGEP
jgi:MFS family permease